MAEYTRTINVGFSNKAISIQYDVDVAGKLLTFHGEAGFQNVVNFVYQVQNNRELSFTPKNIPLLHKELIVDAVMTDFEKYRQSSNSKN